MRSPKLGSGASQYYRYYAGYTQGFVEDVLKRLDVPRTGIVMDPWNGAGTTTAAAAASGQVALGFDLNPAAVLIGRARVLGADVADSLVPLAVEICQSARSNPYDGPTADDLLTLWFGSGTSREIRSIERAIYRVLVDQNVTNETPVYNSQLPQSSLAAVFYVAMFRAVRQLVQRYVPSNPTWIKSPSGKRIGVRRSEMHAAFVSAVRLSDPHRGQLELSTSSSDPKPIISKASSGALPLTDSSVDAVVSSPPYCTRIDYVKATLPELAVVGLCDQEIRDLRDEMIGTPTMSRDPEQPDQDAWGPKARALVSAVADHKSRASDTYYRKYFTQYFDGMAASLAELHRVIKPGGSAVLVVQDSFYKELHVDLPGLIGDMADAGSWSSWERSDFDVPRTMAAINPATRKYRTDFRAVESAVLLTR